MDVSSKDYVSLAERLLNARSVVAMTGAGVSNESGVPTFRGLDGLWNKYRPEELATPGAFRRNPELVLEWYNWRRDLIKAVKPNPGHYALAELETLLEDFTLITQNVDNLHYDAGSRNIIEVHGNISKEKCFMCDQFVQEEDIIRKKGDLPRHNCPAKGLIRPGVVWFGEQLPPGAIEQSSAVSEKADVFLSIGTSSKVYPAAGFVMDSKTNGGYCVEINPVPTDQAGIMDLILQGPSGEILPKIVEAVKAL